MASTVPLQMLKLSRTVWEVRLCCCTQVGCARRCGRRVEALAFLCVLRATCKDIQVHRLQSLATVTGWVAECQQAYSG